MSRQTVAKWLKDMLPKKCYNCGDTKHLTYHHIVPVSRGGNDIPSNIAVLCPVCHAKADFERRGTVGHGLLISEGIERARKRGVKVGRPVANYEHIMRLIAENSTQFNDINNESYTPMTEHEIMAMAGVKEVCYAKCKRMLFDAMSQDTWPYSWDKPKHAYYRPLYDMQVRKLRGETA